VSVRALLNEVESRRAGPLSKDRRWRSRRSPAG